MSGDGRHHVIRWNVRQPSTPPTHLCCHATEVWALAFSLDGQWLASGGENGTVSVWDIETRRPIIQAAPDHPSRVVNMTFRHNRNELLLGYRSGHALRWDIPAGRTESLLPQWLEEDADRVAFSPDGAMLAESHPDGSIILWNVEQKRAIHQLEGDKIGLTHLVFSSNGTKLASRDGEGTIVLWDLGTPYPQRLGQPLIGSTGQIVFSPDGTKLASCGTGETIILWDIAEVSTSPPRRVLLEDAASSVHSLAFSPDGNTVVSGHADGTVVLWEVSDELWKARACRVANRNLTQEEWSQFIVPYAPWRPYKRICSPLPPIKDT